MAWLVGWDAGVLGFSFAANPYRRKPQALAWEDGRLAGRRNGANDVKVAARMAKKKR
jgi:hypothetical protein